MNPRALLYVLGGAGLVGIFVFFVAFDIAQKKSLLKVELGQAQNEYLTAETVIRQLPVMLSTEKLIKDTRERFEDKLYARAEILGLIDEIKSQASKSGLTLREITPPVEELLALRPSPGDSLKPKFLNILVKFRGQYHEFGDFVVALEGKEYFRGVNYCGVFRPEASSPFLELAVGFRAILGIEVAGL